LMSDDAIFYMQTTHASLIEQGMDEAAASLAIAHELVVRARQKGIDAYYEHRKNLPILSDTIWDLFAALETAQRRGAVREQIKICREAIELADQEGKIPTWSLTFREHLQGLPDL
jgi:Cdc6-like AAA superfamily ATPase